MLGNDLDSSRVSLVEELANLVVDRFGGSLRARPLLADLAAKQHRLLRLIDGHGAEVMAHAIAFDHVVRQAGGMPDVVVRACAGLAIHEAFSSVPAQG